MTLLKTRLQKLRANFAWLILLSAFAWSCIMVASQRIEEAKPDTITIRIGHWQLEAGIREAFDQLAADYRRDVNPNVVIIQDAIPETIYGQWISSQLLSGNAPDLVELGLGLPGHIWLAYKAKYFLPNNDIAGEPNPYNKGTELENVPLRMTYYDGMSSSYVQELQDYVGVPLSQYSVRVFYNRDLLRKLTGRDTPPVNYRDFIDACKKISAQRDPQGNRYTPIASSKYHIPMWESPMLTSLTYPVLNQCDFNRDGTAGNDETYAAFRAGLLSFDHPAVRARFKMTQEVFANFQTGFSGLTRDEAVFLFAQQKAVFMSTGTWDAGSLLSQAAGQFEVGVMPFPRPSRDDPDYGSVSLGPYYEQTSVGFQFAVASTSRHPEVARDFLRYLSSRANNEKFNKLINWVPAINGAAMPTILKGFEPQTEGVYNGLNLTVGGDSYVRWLQQYSLFQIGQTSYEEMVKQFEPYYIEKGVRDLKEGNRGWPSSNLSAERLAAGVRARALTVGPDDPAWNRYRDTAALRALNRVNHAQQMRLIDKGPANTAVGPYEYSPAVLQKIREKLAATNP